MGSRVEEDQKMRSLITGVASLAAIVGVELPLAVADGSTWGHLRFRFQGRRKFGLHPSSHPNCDDQEGKTASRSDGPGDDAVRRVPSPSDRTCCDQCEAHCQWHYY